MDGSSRLAPAQPLGFFEQSSFTMHPSAAECSIGRERYLQASEKTDDLFLGIMHKTLLYLLVFIIWDRIRKSGRIDPKI